MTLPTMNELIRKVLNTLIDQGYKKNQLAMVLLGAQGAPQIEKFLEGRELGNKPMMRIIHQLGYEYKIVPINKNDTEKQNIINEYCAEFLDSLPLVLHEKLEHYNNNLYKSRNSLLKQISESITFDLNEIEEAIAKKI